METQQSSHAPWSGPEVKNGSSAKDGEARMRDSPEGGELDPAEGVRRRCKKNYSVLSCVVRGQEKAVTVAASDSDRIITIPRRKPKKSGRIVATSIQSTSPVGAGIGSNPIRSHFC